MADQKFSGQEVSDALSALPGWNGDQSGLTRVVPAGGAGEEPGALVAELRSAVSAAQVERHGDDVVVRLGAGGVTAQDVEQAAVVDRVLAATTGE